MMWTLGMKTRGSEGGQGRRRRWVSGKKDKLLVWSFLDLFLLGAGWADCLLQRFLHEQLAQMRTRAGPLNYVVTLPVGHAQKPTAEWCGKNQTHKKVNACLSEWRHSRSHPSKQWMRWKVLKLWESEDFHATPEPWHTWKWWRRETFSNMRKVTVTLSRTIQYLIGLQYSNKNSHSNYWFSLLFLLCQLGLVCSFQIARY